MKTIKIEQLTCLIDEQDDSDSIVIELIFEESVKTLDEELTLARQMSTKPFIYVGVLVQDWDNDLSPWNAPQAYGNERFAGNGPFTFAWLKTYLLPYLRDRYKECNQYYLAGYSLAALFALWCGYQCRDFNGIGSASPSLWFEGWDNYMTHEFQANKAYLSLGNKEHKTRNQTLRTVKKAIEKQYEVLQTQHINCVLEMNHGNHFQNVPERMAKAIVWLLNEENKSII